MVGGGLYAKLLSLGIHGLKKEINDHRPGAEVSAIAFYDGLCSTLDTYAAICGFYIRWINENMAEAAPTLRRELLEIRASLCRIMAGSAQTLRDAIQMVLLWWYYAGDLNFARMDTYLSGYYVRDVDSSRLTEAENLALLCELWRMIVARRRPYDSRIVIGGRGRQNERDCDRFCLLAIKATRTV